MDRLKHPHPCGRISAIARLGSVENWAYLIIQTQNENKKEAELPQNLLSIDHQECHGDHGLRCLLQLGHDLIE